ncbi:MAG: LuxR C-terminal-related transcriptional regulator, partial [Anaerolineae bacterium]|nr:LuxR C-terminal-related transcriptional regulator [Anaerolineae bacterium]
MAFESYPALLVTKLYVPQARSAHVSRGELLAVLDTRSECKLVLIAAAAGFGKTSLVADWCNQRAEKAAWFSLDEGDNDPIRFLSYVVAAIQTCYPDVGGELLAALQSPQPPPTAHALATLVNQLARTPNRLLLVLDDYHVIENRAVHEALSFLLDHLPPQKTIIMLTRADPSLPLARLRARGELLELRADRLRFSAQEIADFLNHKMGFNLPPEALQALDTRTEGWIAGLQLAAVAMQSLSEAKQAFIDSFTGSHRFILDYLIEEVLSQQPENVRHFLLQTSVLHRLNGSLCSAVTGAADGQAMLEHLERNNLFLIPLDQARYWYRYHHLFADLLRARLLAENPDSVAELQSQAARWHEANGLPEEAILYALDASDFEYAASLMTGSGAGVTRRGEVTTLLDWYRKFPPDFVAGNPQLCLQFGLAFALNGQWHEAETLLSYVEQREADSRPDDALLLAYLVATYRQDAARLRAIAAEAAAAPTPDRVTKMVLGLIVGLSGDLRHACQLMAEAQESSERAGDYSLALTALFHQCRYQVFLGNLHEAYGLCQEALARIQQIGDAALPMASFAHTSLGRIHIEWNELDRAEQHLSQAIQLGELSGFVTGMVSSATMMLAEVKQAWGDSHEAADLARKAMAAAERNDPPTEVIWLKTYQARLWLRQGDMKAAGQWMREVQTQQQSVSLFYPAPVTPITQARFLFMQRKTDEVIALLMRLLNAPRHLLTVEGLALLALARAAQGDHVHAWLTLEQALVAAETENRVRAFLDLGAPMAKLLGRYCEVHPEQKYAQKILANFPAGASEAVSVESLSERELEILRLIAGGHSNEEIAQRLVLAVSTVKWYINELYGKLHVKTRGQA